MDSGADDGAVVEMGDADGDEEASGVAEGVDDDEIGAIEGCAVDNGGV